MRVERRGRIVWVCLVVNRCCRDEPGEWAEVVRDIEARGLAGLSTGQGQQGCGGCGWAVNPGVRAGPEKESVQTVESALVRQLFPAAGTDGGNTEVRRKRGQDPRRTHCRRLNRANGGGHVPGTGSGNGLPSRLLRVPAGS